MGLENILSLTEARKNLFTLADKAQKAGQFFTLTEHGRPKAVLMSYDEFDSWQETLEVMRDFPDLKKDIEEARKEYKRGDYVTLEELLAEEGFVLADKSKRKYEVQNSRAKKGKKRNKKG